MEDGGQAKGLCIERQKPPPPPPLLPARARHARPLGPSAIGRAWQHHRQHVASAHAGGWYRPLWHGGGAIGSAAAATGSRGAAATPRLSTGARRLMAVLGRRRTSESSLAAAARGLLATTLALAGGTACDLAASSTLVALCPITGRWGLVTTSWGLAATSARFILPALNLRSDLPV